MEKQDIKGVLHVLGLPSSHTEQVYNFTFATRLGLSAHI